LGIPLGVILFDVFAPGLAPVQLPAVTYIAVAIATPLLYAMIVAIPTRMITAQPLTPLLAYE
jgi:hypothetical protein